MQGTDLCCVQEASCADAIGGDQEVPAPTELFKHVGNVSYGAHSTVVKTEQARVCRSIPRKQFRCRCDLSLQVAANGPEMMPKGHAIQFVKIRVGTDKAAFARVTRRNHVM